MIPAQSGAGVQVHLAGASLTPPKPESEAS